MRSNTAIALTGAWLWLGCGDPAKPDPDPSTSTDGPASSSSAPQPTTGPDSTSSSSASSTGSVSTSTASTSTTTTDPTTTGTTAEPDTTTGDTTTGAIDCTFTDLDSGLCWQEPPAPGLYTWQEASAYCEAIGLRLPNVQELASLVRGCPAAMCPVEDPGCLSLACRLAPECMGCAMLAGPGAGGCYWDPALTGPCDWYWTASGVDEGPFDAFFIYFQVGSVDYGAQSIPKQVRCVRSEP